MNARRPRSGHALVGTMAFLIMVMLLWTATFAQISACLRGAKVFDTRLRQALGPQRALAWGLDLLETGEPAESPYSCRATLSPGQTYVLTFSLIGAWEYTVSVRPAGPTDDSLPEAPEQFPPYDPPAPPDPY